MSPSLWSAHFLEPDPADGDLFRVDESGVAGDVADLDFESVIHYGAAVDSLRADATIMNQLVEHGPDDTLAIVCGTVMLRYRLDYDMRTATLLRLEPGPGE